MAVFNVVRVAQYFVFIVCSISFGHFVTCPSIYGFWLPLSYLQIILNSKQMKKRHHNCSVIHTNHIKNQGKLRLSEWVNRSCSTSATCRVTLVTNSVMSHEGRNNQIVITSNFEFQTNEKKTSQLLCYSC
jgi:hypothetical protein